MRILQLLPVLSVGDAVGNHTIALNTILKEMGYSGEIYAEHINGIFNSKKIFSYNKMPGLKKDDIIIYHLSTGSKINFDLEKYPCRKIIIYHNITPPEYFRGNNEAARENCEWGLQGAEFLSDKVDYGFAVSEFNKNDLIKMGYSCRIDVLPIIIPFKEYAAEPDPEVIKKYSDGYTNIIFTGRIAPNKKQEDVISAFYHYKKNYNPKSRLILAGNYKETDIYYLRLKKYIEEIDISEIIFTGHIKFNEMLAYYKIADLFLCMSEHEGFCVPLIESMIFNLPIIAYQSSAIPETLGGSGFLIKDKDPVFTAGCINSVIRNEDLRKLLIKGQRQRLDNFKYESISERFKQYLEVFIKKGNSSY